MALKSYFDCSGTQGKSISLVAVSAYDKVWRELEPAWNEILRSNSAPYIHMKELMPRVGAFKGWTEQQRDGLLDELEHFLQRYREEPRIKRFSCSVDLEAHSKWAKIRNHPSPDRLCARIVLPHILNWYGGFSEAILDVMDLFFDQNEAAMHHIREDWENKKIRKQYPVWGLIRTITEADMRHTVPLQIADMSAWARNRIESTGNEEMGLFLRHAYTITKGTLMWLHREVGEKAMAESTFREEGLRALNEKRKSRGRPANS